MTAGFLRNILAVRLVIYSLVIGSVLTVFSTGLQLLLSYERQKDQVTDALDQIDQALTQSLEFSLWRLDFTQINVILDGLQANPDVSHLLLTSETGDRWERGTPSSAPAPLQEVYDLVYSSQGGQEYSVGTLVVDVSLENVLARIWDQFWITFLTNLAKAYLAAFALLYVAHKLITRHLSKIASHVADTHLDANAIALQLERSPSRAPDDLDRIVSAILQYDRNARETLSRLRAEVQERIKSEKEAREALSVRSSFIGTMSHEVRTPLNAIMGFLHLIENNDNVPEKQRHYAHVATKASQQLHNQLTNVLEMSRLDSKAVQIVCHPTDIRRLAEQWRATTEASVHFHGKSIAVTLDVDDTLDDTYNLDGARLTQVVTNLTDNAAKFTPSGEIHIAVHTSPVRCEGPGYPRAGDSIADTGEGIDDVQCKSIFDRFTQSDAGLSRAHGGSGLGLTISREICELMTAKLSLVSADGDGSSSTRFLIALGSSVRLEAYDVCS